MNIETAEVIEIEKLQEELRSLKQSIAFVEITHNDILRNGQCKDLVSEVNRLRFKAGEPPINYTKWETSKKEEAE